ncbi:MAG: type IV secretion protein DotI [Gammaproteobacteria bacterium]|nr:type IV secretion protein DotI [Gammaproteobacteria bacterium]
MSHDAFQTMVLRNEYYRDGFRKLVLAIIAAIIALIAALGALYYQVTHPPEPRYFATSPNGMIVPVYPLNLRVFTNAELLEWATEVVMRSFSYDFVNYRTQLQDVAKNFTGLGWRRFRDAIQQSRELDTIIAQQAVMSALPGGAPIILNQGVNQGVYSWMIKIPVILKIQGPINITQPIAVTIQVNRVSLENNPKGIAISQFVAST